MTASALTSVISNSGLTARARSVSRLTDPSATSCAAGVAASGTLSGSTGRSTSPVIPSGSLLVAITRSRGAARRMPGSSARIEGRTCSQLSMTNSKCRSPRKASSFSCGLVAD